MQNEMSNKGEQKLSQRLTQNLSLLMDNQIKQNNDDLSISPTLFKNKKLCSFEEDNNTTMLSSNFNNTQIMSGAGLDTSIFSNQTSLFHQHSQPVLQGA